MLKYEKIYSSEGIDVNKTSTSKEYELCSHCFFGDVGFKFEEHACNRCDDLLTITHNNNFFKKYSDIEGETSYF